MPSAQARRLGRAHPDRARFGPHRAPRAHLQAGSPWLRWILCEAAQTAKRCAEFSGFYRDLSRRRGEKIASTAVARKLLTRAYRLLTRAYRLLTQAQADASTAAAAAAAAAA